MTWDDFFFGYSDWAESTIRTRISSLEDIGSGEDVVWVVMDLSNDKLKTQLIRKAMKYNVSFSQDDFADLEGEISDEVYRELGKYTGYDVYNPYPDEDFEDMEPVPAEEEDISTNEMNQPVGRKKGPGVFGVLFALFAVLFGRHKNHGENVHRNGHCEERSPHYGYRYGRWYYGNDHRYGCEPENKKD